MTPFVPFSLNINGRLTEFNRCAVMGILNVTPDSFYDGGHYVEREAIERRVARMVDEGVDIIDVGACSTRPGAQTVDEAEEIKRLTAGLEAIKRVAPEVLISIDTFRARVAEKAVLEMGAHIINDISGGDMDKEMFATVARLRVPYVLMHTRGTPSTMQQMTHYDDVTADVLEALARKIDALRQLGVSDIVADPGFGFAKDLEQNYRLMASLEAFHALQVPLLVGISRKSMITRLLDCTPQQALNGTTVLHTVALLAGAHFLRVHDVKEAVEARSIVAKLQAQYTTV